MVIAKFPTTLTYMCGVFCNPYWIAGNEKSNIIQRNYPGKNSTGNQKDVVYFEVAFPLRQCLFWVFFNM